MQSIANNEEHIEQEFKEINRLTDRGELKKALELCEALFERHPENPRVLHGVGILRYRTGEDRQGAEIMLRRAIERKPDFADAYHTLGTVLYNSVLLDEAKVQLRKAVECDPNHYKAMTLLATILISDEEVQEARVLCEKVLAIYPHYAPIYQNYGKIMLAFGRIDEAIICFKKSLKMQKVDSDYSSLLFAMNLTPKFSQKDIYHESLRCGRGYVPEDYSKDHDYLNSPMPERRMRIGYVSGDFKWHPVSFYLKPVLAAHNKQHVEIFLYNSFPLADQQTEELAAYADTYRDISRLSDEAAETLIRKDGIDVLIDLAGHTAFNRLRLFARKIAPVQVSWLGYFNTTGLSAIRYLLSDPITNPAHYDAYFTEKVFRLPVCRFCYQPVTYAPAVAATPALRNGYLTFGSFNSLQKITPKVIALWSSLLLMMPDSIIVLKSKLFEDENVTDEYFHKFAAHGIIAERIELRTKSRHIDMLHEYGDIDIALDTFPYNGGATTCEALWMGVPVVTLEGGTPVSRQSKAFLHAIGYPEWAASTADGYIEIVKGLTSDLDSLQQIRVGLRQKMTGSPLCDCKAFTGHLEAAYRHMWQRWCSETTPVPAESFMEFSNDELCAAGYNYLNDGEIAQALDMFNRILHRDPMHVQTLNGLGEANEKNGASPAAAKLFRKAIRCDPSFFHSYFNLGLLLLNSAKLKEARRAFLLALKRDPTHIETLINLGVANRLLGKLRESQNYCERALEISSKNTALLELFAYVLADQGDITRAMDLFKKAITFEPENPKLLVGLMALMFYSVESKQKTIFELSKQIAQSFRSEPVEAMPFAKRDLLRIGFVSSDFRHHPVGLLLMALFKEYNSKRLSLYCYCNLFKPDAWTEWYQEHATAWRDISRMSEVETADQIRDDKIDILVDLSGHTTGNRLHVFSLRPAPINASWMGFGHTTGLESIDYIIADDDFICPQDEQWFSEQVLRLPHNRFCFVPPTPSPDVVEPPFYDNDFITFGSFNNPMKISELVVAVWAQILLSVPRSRLVLKYYAFGDSSVRKRYLNLFAKHGIGRSRIKFRNNTIPFFMMAEYGEIDIALDPFPFTGGMTSLFSLWMGVPIISLSGELPISRQTKSFLDLVGLSDLVVYTQEAYVEKAVSLAKDTERLTSVRETLRRTMLESPLCDAKKYASDVCDLFFKMWEDKRSKFVQSNR